MSNKKDQKPLTIKDRIIEVVVLLVVTRVAEQVVRTVLRRSRG